jgi:hypothetical protein
MTCQLVVSTLRGTMMRVGTWDTLNRGTSANSIVVTVLQSKEW